MQNREEKYKCSKTKTESVYYNLDIWVQVSQSWCTCELLCDQGNDQVYVVLSKKNVFALKKSA